MRILLWNRFALFRDTKISGEGLVREGFDETMGRTSPSADGSTPAVEETSSYAIFPTDEG